MNKFDPLKYFKEVAVKHKQISHTDEKPAFFREFGSANILFNNSDFLTKMRDCANTALVAQFNEDGGINANNIDNNSRTYDGAIYLIRKVDVTDYDGIESTRKDLILIWNDIYAKLSNDIRKEQFHPSPSGLNFKIYAIGMIADSFYGIAILMSYSEKYCVKYDASKWI